MKRLRLAQSVVVLSTAFAGYTLWQSARHADLRGEVALVCDRVMTHSVSLDRAPEMYKTFRDKQDGCIKAVLKPGMTA